VDGIENKPNKQMKVLGMVFQGDLKEDAQVARITRSYRALIPKLKFLGRFLTKDHMKMVVTAQQNVLQ